VRAGACIGPDIRIAAFFDDTETLPSPELLEGPQFAQWMAIYIRAYNAGMFSEIVRIAERIVALSEASAQSAARLDRLP
jgi:hypothetical protein